MFALLRSKSEVLTPDLIRFAQELIRTPSPSLEEGRVADLVQNEMENLGYDRVFRDELGNVIGLLRGRKASPTLILNSHLDTVASRPGSSWNWPPHSARIENGRLYGLGAADCKGGLAAQVYAGALLLRSMLPLRGNLVVAATVAEENGRSLGVRGLIEKTLPAMELNPDYAILGEPTGLKLFHGHNGWAELRVRVKSENDFIVHDLVKSIAFNLEKHSTRSKDPCAAEISLQPPAFTCDADGISHGSFRVTRRLHQHESVNGLLDQLRHEADLLCPSSGAVSLDIDVCSEQHRIYNGHKIRVRNTVGAWETDPFHPLMDRARQLLQAAGCETRAGKWQLERLGMGTAGSVLVNEHRIPTIGYGPGEEGQAHRVDEYVELDKLKTAVYATACIAHGLVGIPVFGWTSDDI